MAVLLAALGTWALTRTRAGAAVRAAADDPQMLAATGISPRAVHTGVLAVSGALAGAAGSLGAPSSAPARDRRERTHALPGRRGARRAALAVGHPRRGPPGRRGPDPRRLAGPRLGALPAVRRHGRRTGAPLAADDGTGVPESGERPGETRAGRALAALRRRPERALATLAARWNNAPRPRPMTARWPPRWPGCGPRPPRPRPSYCSSRCSRSCPGPWTPTPDPGRIRPGPRPARRQRHHRHRIRRAAHLGQTAPFAVGAYATALFADKGWTTGPLLVLLAAVTAALFSLVTGPAVIRARGTTVLMITLAVGS
ncbi:hypothetical protein NKH77_48035 [Streptomyces sp. M19]